jgi:hypothetical protein
VNVSELQTIGTLIVVGVVFGLVPMGLLGSAIITESQIKEKKVVPTWLLGFAGLLLEKSVFYSIKTKRFFPATLRIIAVIWIIACLLITEVMIYNDIKKGLATIGNLLEFQIMPVSFVLTFLVPNYYLNRFLARRKVWGEGEKEEISLWKRIFWS